MIERQAIDWSFFSMARYLLCADPGVANWLDTLGRLRPAASSSTSAARPR